jgi:hypothetical protein
VTVGVEIPLLKWFSVEPFIQLYLGDPYEEFNLNLDAGVRLLFPVKFLINIFLEPYAIISLPFNTSPTFDSLPYISAGAGFQVGFMKSNWGALFLDFNYQFGIGNAVMNNNYSSVYPNPSTINYQRSAIGIGVGYKYGFNFNFKKSNEEDSEKSDN